MNSSSGISGNGGPYDVTSLSLSKKPATIASTALCALLNSRLTSHNDGGAGTSRLVVLELDGRHVVEHVNHRRHRENDLRAVQCMHSRPRAWKKWPSRPCNGSIFGLPTSTQASKSRSDADAPSTWPPSSFLPVSSRVLPPYFAVASRLAVAVLCPISDLRLRSASPSASAFALASSSTGPLRANQPVSRVPRRRLKQ